jgi:hypothetical protein
MRVIITGGTGLIGRALTGSLVSDGHQVIVLSRNPARATDLPAGASAERWDGHTAAGWGPLVSEAVIVNLAGENIAARRWTPKRKRQIRESRFDAGKAVLAAVEAAAIKPLAVIQASAVGYYGACGEEVVTEEHPPGRDFLAGVCLAWEASTAPVEALGVLRAVIRSAPVLSSRDGVLPRMVGPFRYFVGGPLGSGRQWFPWIHIDDEVAAIRFLIENGAAHGPFNLASPHPVSNAEFSRSLGQVLHRPAFMRVPAFALRLVLGEMATVLLEGQRAIPQHLQEMGFSFRYPEIRPALEDVLGSASA